MVATAPVLTVTQADGIVTTEWTSVNQKAFKISVTRVRGGRLEAEPTYGTERWNGHFADHIRRTGDPQAHLIYSDTADIVIWDGLGEASGTICNGTWEIRLYYINQNDERSATVSERITVSGVPCPGEPATDDETEQGELPAPVLSLPSALGTNNSHPGINVVLTWTVPGGNTQAEYKASIYRAQDVNSLNEPLDGVKPVYGSIREESQRDDPVRSHWVPGGTKSITFSDTSPNGNAQICSGAYVARVRYEDGQDARSAAGSIRFEVSAITCPAPLPTPDEADAPAITPGTAGTIRLTPDPRWSPTYARSNGWDIPAYENLLLRWSVVFASGLPQARVTIQRQVTAIVRNASGTEVSRSTVAHYWNGNSTGTIWQTAPTSVARGANYVSLKGNAPANSTRAGNWLQYWWGQNGAANRWQNSAPASPTGNYTIYTNIQFLISVLDSAGNRVVSDWFVFQPQSFPAFTLTRQAHARLLRFRMTLSDVTIGSSNRITEFKVAVYKRNDDGTQGEIVAGTTRFRGQPLDAPGAHWAPIQLLGVEETVIVEADITPSIYFSGWIPAGNYIVAARIRDLFNQTSYRRTHHLLNYAPGDPQVRDIQPVRLADLDNGSPTFDPPLTGLDPGIGVAVIYYTPTGTDASDPTPNDILIERREFSRTDNQPLNLEPQEIFVWADRATDRPSAPSFANIQGAAIWYFYDMSVESGVQYQYRVTLIDTRTGGRRVRAWTPA